jgi:hypothetical protein
LRRYPRQPEELEDTFRLRRCDYERAHAAASCSADPEASVEEFQKVRLDDKVTRYCILCDGDVRRNTWAVGGFEQELQRR